MFPEQSVLKKLFPEQDTLYTIHSQYSNKSISDMQFADEMVSITQDVDGTNYALGFGESKVPKQRDLEIRFYIVYILGTLGRYHPEKWMGLSTQNPFWYFIIRRFLEHNQILFPLIVLRYLSGRTVSINLKKI